VQALRHELDVARQEASAASDAVAAGKERVSEQQARIRQVWRADLITHCVAAG
jgi:hypothetical protein